LPVLSVLIIGAYILGATALEDFGLALTIGLITGAYSSIYIASPLLGVLKDREPRYAAVRQRIAARGGAPSAPLTPAAAAAGAAALGEDGGPPLRPAAARASNDTAAANGGGTRTSRPSGAARSGGRPSGSSRPAPRPPKKRKRR
jgi:preprotein translocase subunit SecF